LLFRALLSLSCLRLDLLLDYSHQASSKALLMKISFTKGKFLHLYALLGVLLLLSLTTLWWMQFARSFPFVNPGLYLGSIESGSDKLMFYVEREEGDNELLFVVIEDGWVPQRVRFLSDSLTAKNTIPATINGPDSRLSLVGTEVRADQYSGTAYDRKGDSIGRWFMRRMYREPDPLLGDDDLIRWLRVRGELFFLEQQKITEQNRLTQVNEEIQRLDSLVTDRDDLHLSVEDRLEVKSDELKTVQRELDIQRARLASLQNQIELAQRVTAMGKLVSLSRETFDREARYVESMFRAAPAETAPAGMESELEKAQLILELRSQIRDERLKIDELNFRLSGRER